MDPPEHWADLCLEQSTYIPTDDGENGTHTSVFLDDDWLTPDELEIKGRSTTGQDTIRATFEEETRPTGSNLAPPATMASKNASTEHTDVPDLIAEPAATQQREQRSSRREPSVSQRTQRETSMHQRESLSTAPAPSAVPSLQESTGLSSPSPFRRSARSNKGSLQTTKFMDEVYLNSLHCFADPDSYQAQLAYLAEVLTCSDSGVINIVDPRVYAVKVRGGNADNPTYQQAINGADSAEYLKLTP